jgi:amino acid transporter
MHNLNTWDGFTQLGLVIGCSSAFLALLGSSIAYLRQKPRAYGWALIALFVAAMVLVAAVGIYRV